MNITILMFSKILSIMQSVHYDLGDENYSDNEDVDIDDNATASNN